MNSFSERMSCTRGLVFVFCLCEWGVMVKIIDFFAIQITFFPASVNSLRVGQWPFGTIKGSTRSTLKCVFIEEQEGICDHFMETSKMWKNPLCCTETPADSNCCCKAHHTSRCSSSLATCDLSIESNIWLLVSRAANVQAPVYIANDPLALGCIWICSYKSLLIVCFSQSSGFL